MQTKLNTLVPTLGLLNRKIDIIPALGGASDEPALPDEEEAEDSIINEDYTLITDFAEKPSPTRIDQYYSTPPIFRAQRHLYRFFIDGSRLTYHLGTGFEGESKSFPIQLGQVGSAVMHRDDHGRVRPLEIKHNLLLLVPRGGQGLSDTVWSMLEQLNTSDELLQIVDTSTETPNTHKKTRSTELRARAQGIASAYMHRLEILSIKSTQELRDENNWLIIDGTLTWEHFFDEPYVIGVAKNFSKNLQFKIRGAKSQNITRLLAGLRPEERTPAFRSSSHGGAIAFWYLRLRNHDQLTNPLQGIVKVELPLIGQQTADTEFINFLSQTLVAERAPTPYGQDQRWHCHLYPIYCAEQTIKNHFFSSERIRGMARYPRRYEQEVLL